MINDFVFLDPQGNGGNVSAKYTGETLNGMPHGMGYIEFNSYVGYGVFKNGIIHGGPFILWTDKKRTIYSTFITGMPYGLETYYESSHIKHIIERDQQGMELLKVFCDIDT